MNDTHTITEFERRCQKPDHRRVGNWMARRVARPLALRVTRLVIPLGISAHAMTLIAWATGIAAAVAFGFGTASAWLVGAGMLQLWYLFDHVDGQLARYHRRESLDGAALDYVMHHAINLLVPFGLGWGAAVQTGQQAWIIVGLGCGAGLLLIGLVHDSRYKAIFKRLKRLEGELRVTGGADGRPTPQPAMPRSPVRLLAWTARKACEIHVVMNLVTLVALSQCILLWTLEYDGSAIGRWYLAGLAACATLVAAAGLLRGLKQEAAEREFAAWFAPPPGSTLELVDGWWQVKEIHGDLAP
jgi:hypothetical protein